MKSSSIFTILSILQFLHRALAQDGKYIIGGEEVDPIGRYPYQVALVSEYGFQFCGGSLVHKDWVLSAAHCYGLAFAVEIGRHNLTDSTEVYESIEIDWERRHPKYNSFTTNNDFMMVKLKQSSSYSTVTLDEGSTVTPGDAVTVMGWGVTESGVSSDILLEVEVDLVSNRECNSDYLFNRITGSMMCASREGKDSCQGDSGGPLIMKGEDASSDVLVGIVSWGIGCADPNYPGVYARVCSEIDWIKKQIASDCRDNNRFPRMKSLLNRLRAVLP